MTSFGFDDENKSLIECSDEERRELVSILELDFVRVDVHHSLSRRGHGQREAVGQVSAEFRERSLQGKHCLGIPRLET